MREYSRVAPTFWTGDTGRRIRKLGRDAQVAAMYVMTCGSANMIGLYYLALPIMEHETGIDRNDLAVALASLDAIGFLEYDPDDELMWIPEMVRYQTGADRLAPDDNRVKGIRRELSMFTRSRFHAAFMAKWGKAYSLSEGPEPTPPKAKTSEKTTPPKGSEGGTGTPLKGSESGSAPLGSQAQAQAQAHATAQAQAEKTAGVPANDVGGGVIPQEGKVWDLANRVRDRSGGAIDERVGGERERSLRAMAIATGWTRFVADLDAIADVCATGEGLVYLAAKAKREGREFKPVLAAWIGKTGADGTHSCDTVFALARDAREYLARKAALKPQQSRPAEIRPAGKSLKDMTPEERAEAAAAARAKAAARAAEESAA
jgi:hypothetical protein